MPKITRIEQQKRNKERYSIYVNEQFFAGASLYIIKKHKLAEGKEVEPALLKQICFEDDVEKAKEYTINYLLNKTEKEIRNRLFGKGYSEEVIEEVIKFLYKYKLINDLEYAKRLSNDAMRIKSQGKKMIEYKLHQKGVKKEEINEALSRIPFDEEVEIAKRKLETKIESYNRKAKDVYQLKGKCYNFLLGRGFGHEVTQMVMEKLDWEQYKNSD
jgi:regulatory protein